MKAQAIRIHETGGPEVLRVEEIDVPAPRRGEVRIKQTAIGVNFTDTYNRTGLYRQPLPIVLGHEAAGIVEAVGEDVQGLRVGDRVAYAGGPIGAYASARLYPAERLVPLPDWIDDQTAASVLLKGMTAEYLLRRCFPVQAGQTILVHAAAGGTGQILVQWATHLGATVIATAGGEEKLALARKLGAAHTIDYRTEDVAKRVREITGGVGVPVAYDSVGASTFEGPLGSLARRGTVVSFGNASGPVPAFSPLKLQQNGSLFFTRPTLVDYVATTPELDACAAALFEAIGSGAVKIDIGQTFPLSQTRAAHEALESRGTTGSTLLIP